MKSELPKVLQPLAGAPLLAHVVATARSLRPDAIHVVHGHGAEAVRAAIAGGDIRWALQAEQKGTGHAVAQAMPGVPDGHDVLVLYGDVPLIRAATLADLVARSGPDALALLSARLPDPAGYGRVVRDATGRVARIVEERDASPEERAIDGDQHRRPGCARGPAARLARRAQGRQFAGGVLSDRLHRRRGAGRLHGRGGRRGVARGGARGERQGPARGGGNRAAREPRGRTDARGRDGRRSRCGSTCAAKSPAAATSSSTST